jgi:RHS repeat-associated protein
MDRLDRSGDLERVGIGVSPVCHPVTRHLVTQNFGTTYFIHTDWLGTERARSTLPITPVETCTSLPYGDNLTCTGTDASPLHFTGKMHDAETNLDEFPARYYSSTQGRWYSPDWASAQVPVPYADLRNPQSLNLYDYVGGDPTNHADADGHRDYAQSNSGNACYNTASAECAASQNQEKAGQAAAQTAQNQSQQDQSQTSAASAGVLVLPALGRAILGAEEGGEAGAVAGTVEPGGGNAVGAVAGAVTGAVVAVVAPQVYSKSKDEAKKAWKKLDTAIEHLGKLSGPGQDPRRGWKATVRRAADEMDAHADRMTGHQGISNAIHFAADLVRGLIPNDPI